MKATHTNGRALKLSTRMRFAMMMGILLTLSSCEQAMDQDTQGADVTVIPITTDIITELKSPTAAMTPLPAPTYGPVDTSADYQYTFGPGDVLTFKLWEAGQDEGSNPYTALATSLIVRVESDGSGYFSRAGRLQIAGKTMIELRAEVLNGLKQYFNYPQFDIQVQEFHSQKVTVSGAVAKPGAQYLAYEPLTVRKAIEVAGGPSAGGDIEQAEIIHADGRRETVNLLALIYHADIGRERILRDGDTVLVPDNHRNKVFVLGEVYHAGSQFIGAGRLTLTEALSEAGGVNVVTSDDSRIYVIRNAISREALAAYDAGLDTTKLTNDADVSNRAVYQLDVNNASNYAMADQFLLHPRDIVYVAAAPITQWSRFISQLIPTAFSYSTSTTLNNR